MNDFSINDVAEVFELRSFQNVNEYLRAGWVLLHNHTFDYGAPDARHQKTVYALGWPKQKGESVHPKISKALEESNR
jgi:hypothetical protein